MNNGTTTEPTLDLWARYKVSRSEEDKAELTLRGCIDNDTDLDGVSEYGIIMNELRTMMRNKHD